MVSLAIKASGASVTLAMVCTRHVALVVMVMMMVVVTILIILVRPKCQQSYITRITRSDTTTALHWNEYNISVIQWNERYMSDLLAAEALNSSLTTTTSEPSSVPFGRMAIPRSTSLCVCVWGGMVVIWMRTHLSCSTPPSTYPDTSSRSPFSFSPHPLPLTLAPESV